MEQGFTGIRTLMGAVEPQTKKHGSKDTPQILEAVTIGVTPEKLFAFWRNFSNLPRFMKAISHIEVKSPTESHWVIKPPVGPTVEWDAKITDERENEMIAWESVGESAVQQKGTIWFRKAPANRGTVVSLALDYHIRGGALAEIAAKLIGEDPRTLIQVHLRNLKAYLETGEIPTIDGQSSGRDQADRESETH